jgi:hypothetical protein
MPKYDLSRIFIGKALSIRHRAPGINALVTHLRLSSRSLVLLLFLTIYIAGCAPLQQPVVLTYERFVNASGGSGQIFVAVPETRYSATPFRAGKEVLGKTGEEDIFTQDNPARWFFTALAEELSAAGYEVKACPELPDNVSKGIRPAIVGLSAHQSFNVLTVSTVAEVKLEAQVFKNGRLIKTLAAGARDEYEGVERSSEPIRLSLEKTLQGSLQQLIPDIIKNLE